MRRTRTPSSQMFTHLVSDSGQLDSGGDSDSGDSGGDSQLDSND